MTLEDRPAAAIRFHVTVGLLAARTVLTASRDDATVGVVTTSTIVQTVGETVSCDDTAGSGHWLNYTCERFTDAPRRRGVTVIAVTHTVDGQQRLLDTCTRRVV